MSRRPLLAVAYLGSLLLIVSVHDFVMQRVVGAGLTGRREEVADEVTPALGGRGASCCVAGDGFDMTSRVSKAPEAARVTGRDLFSAGDQPARRLPQAPAGSGGVAQGDVRKLEPGKAVERELAGGEAHFYEITLASGQYLRMLADQRGIDVAVVLFAPGGKKLFEANSTTVAQGSESASVVADASGDYRVGVLSLEGKEARGRYELRVEELRAATAQDRDRAAAESFFLEGEQLRKQKTPTALRSALEKYEAALALWRAAGERLGEVRTLNGMGQAFYALGERQKSLDQFQRALQLSRDAGSRQWEATTLRGIGLVYTLLGESQKALDNYMQALPLLRAVGDRFGESLTLNNIGTIYWNLGENRKALDYYNRALPLRRATGDRRGEAYTLHGIGLAYSSLGENQEALLYYDQVLQIWRALEDRSGEGNILNAIGLTYSLFGESQKALDYYARALQLRREVGDRREEAYTLNNIGLVYYSLGESQKALDYYGRALPLLRGLGDRRGEAYTLHNIGDVYGDAGEPRALDYYTQALSLKRAIGDRFGEALTLNNIGLVASASGEPQKALGHYRQALQLQRAVGDRRGEAGALHNIGKVYWSLGEVQQALDHYNQALLLRRAVEDRSGEAISLAAIARAERDRGDLLKAREQIEAALDIVESLRMKVVSQELRASFFASKRDYYDFYIDLLMRLHARYPSGKYDAAALQASERARARSLLEILAEARADIRQGISPVLIERERSVEQQLHAKAEGLTRLLSGRHTEEQAAAARKELDESVARYKEAQAQIRASNPRYAALTQPAPLSLEEIQRQLLDDSTVLLEYSLGEERSYLWALTPTSISSFELPRRAEVEAAARLVYELLTARNRRVPNETPERERARLAEADAGYTKAAAALSRMLLGPVATQLGTKRLLIVSEGALQYMPFGALPVPSTANESQGAAPGDKTNRRQATAAAPPLIVEHEIVTLPSASALVVLRREIAGRKPADKMLAVFADPVFESDDQRVISAAARGGGRYQDAPTRGEYFEPSAVAAARLAAEGAGDQGAGGEVQSKGFKRLRFSRREAEQIAKLAPAGRTFVALDFTAARKTVKSEDLGQYRLVHFATHALLDSSHPELSGIVLSLVDENGRPQDGFLRLYEIYNLKLGADLVALSACQTALGKEVKGEGLVGMTRGFMYAGAARVLASLWAVEDSATAELMGRFYRGMLRDGQRPAAALRSAQVSMWKERRWQTPYYWAAFVLQGEWK